jgi:hypothetical protein
VRMVSENMEPETMRRDRAGLFQRTGCAASVRTLLTLQCYADPLRAFAKDKNTQIIPLYEAKNLFANIDLIVPASHAFLADLEVMWASEQGEATVGDVCLRHVRVPWTCVLFKV